MNAKQFLKSVRKLDLKIENKQMEIESLYSMLESVTVAPKEINVQTTLKIDKDSETIAKIVDLKSALEKEVQEFLKIKFQTIFLIDQLEDDEHVNILMKRYIQYEAWEDIARDLGYTRQTIDNKHGKALLEFEKLLTRFDMI